MGWSRWVASSPRERAASTHGREGKEGDADEGEGRRQQPPIPGLGVLVPIADGGEGDLGKESTPQVTQIFTEQKAKPPKFPDNKADGEGWGPCAPRADKTWGAAEPARLQHVSADSSRDICMHKELVLFIPLLPSSVY